MATPFEMGTESKGTRPQIRKAESKTHVLTPQGHPEHGRYDGLYRLDGFTLVRSDGLTLVRCYSPGNPGPRGSNYHLVNASDPGRPRVGNLYRSPNLDGAEFDDQIHRYRIERIDTERYRVVTLYRKGRRGRVAR